MGTRLLPQGLRTFPKWFLPWEQMGTKYFYWIIVYLFVPIVPIFVLKMGTI